VTPIENQHRHITGYRDLPEDTVGRINWIKEVEQEVTRALENVAQEAGKLYSPNVLRHLAIARTELETGFMYLIKAVARPTNGLANARLHGVGPTTGVQSNENSAKRPDTAGGG
jgi:hypothetical protein